MSIRFGVSPLAWINDDMPELGGDTPLVTALGDARDIGFAGVELGGKFRRGFDELSMFLGGCSLKPVGGWYSAELLTRAAEGWIIVEAEQDPAIADPREYSRVGLETLRRSTAATCSRETS